MNTKIRTLVMLVAMIIGTLAANAQSARRGDNKNSEPSTSKSYKKPAETRKAPVPRQQTARHTSTTTRNNPKSDYRKPDNTVHVGKTYKDPNPASRPVNNNKVYQGNNKIPHNANTNTYSRTMTHRSHNYYPVDRVKIHVHPTTYRGNYRALYYPRYSEIYWTRSMHRHYASLYPGYTGWHYRYGYSIQTMSAFDAIYNVNEIARVYGRVYATWYNEQTDDLLLFFGGEYPNQVFTVILPGDVARRYSWRPERYFLGEHLAVTGLITMFEGKAEMVVRKKSQLDVY